MTDINFSEIEAYYRVLGLEPGEKADKVKEAYRHHLQAFHPDKYPKDSSGQKWASEKLVQVNEANEMLGKFFQQYPDGQPPGGWTSKPNSGASSANYAESSESNSDQSTDWASWEKRQSTSFESELHSWEKREQKRQTETQKGKEYDDRKKIVFFGKIVLVVILLCLWIGRSTNSSSDSYTRQVEADAFRARAIYDRQTRGTSYSTHSQSNEELRQRALGQAKGMTDRWQAQDSEKNFSLIFLLALSGGAVWLFIAKKPKEFLDKWIEGAAQ